MTRGGKDWRPQSLHRVVVNLPFFQEFVEGIDAIELLRLLGIKIHGSDVSSFQYFQSWHGDLLSKVVGRRPTRCGLR